MVDSWHRLDETFTQNQPKIVNASDEPTYNFETYTYESQGVALMTSTRSYSLPKELESHAWFMNSGASYNLTSNPTFLHSKKLYEGHNRVNVVNGESLSIHGVGSSHVFSRHVELLHLS